MNQPTLKLPRLRRDQFEIAQHAAPRRALVAGRRFGKTTLAGCTAIVAANGGLPVGLVAPEYGNLDPIWEFTRRAVMPLKATGMVRLSETDRTIDFLYSNGKIEFFSAKNHAAALGREYALLIFDEAALIDEDVVNATFMPTLADRNGDALAIGTPSGFNWFFNWYQMGQSGDPYYKSWRYSTLANPNPNIHAHYYDMQKRLPARTFTEQYDAEFLDDGLSVFINIDRCATAEKQERAILDHQYVMGLDWGKSADFSAAVILDVTTNEAGHVWRMNEIHYTRQLVYIRDLYERFKPSVILAEQNSIGSPLIEQLQGQNLPVQPFVTSQATKAQMVDTLALEFQNQTIKIIPDPILLSELKIFSGVRTANGMWRYAAAGSGHDDTVIALCLAVTAARDYAPSAWEPFLI